VTESRLRAIARRWRWQLAGAVTVLAATLGVVVIVQATSGAACAAVPSGVVPLAAVPVAVPVGPAVHSGQATYYTSRSGSGNCSFPAEPPDNLYVALSPGEYAVAGACGGYLDVTGPHGTVRVKITDQCPGCATGHIDLSRTAFARIADTSAGLVSVSYRAVTDPPLSAPLSFRVKDGSSRYWFALLVDNHGNPLRSVEAQPAGGGWHPLSRADYNYWLASDGLGNGPFSVRVTDVYGNQATVPGIRLAPSQNQATQVWMYGHGPATSAARTGPTAGATSPSPSLTAAPSASRAGALPSGSAASIPRLDSGSMRRTDCAHPGGPSPSTSG
jgi:expansin (peptidoglycan-binding protein)